MLNDQAVAYIRTVVPYAVGAALAWLLVTLGIDLTGDFQLTFTAFAVVACTNVYYFMVRALEQRFPIVGVLLGVPRSPDYAAGALWTSFVRTAIPTLVGLAVALLLDLLPFLTFGEEGTTAIVAAFIAAVEALYYSAARLVIDRWPTWSRLLGTAVGIAPTYAPRHAG